MCMGCDHVGGVYMCMCVSMWGSSVCMCVSLWDASWLPLLGTTWCQETVFALPACPSVGTGAKFP